MNKIMFALRCICFSVKTLLNKKRTGDWIKVIVKIFSH